MSVKFDLSHCYVYCCATSIDSITLTFSSTGVIMSWLLNHTWPLPLQISDLYILTFSGNKDLEILGA